MRPIPDSFVEELRRRVDIADVVSDYVQLRKTGRSYTGLCPFHNERTPSFTVSADRQMFHCFGCGAGGTVIRFLMDIDGLTFLEAISRLAERANMELPFAIEPAENAATEISRAGRAKEAHELLAKLYNYILMNTAAGMQALAYLETRGFSRNTIVDFQLGYAPESGNTASTFLQRRGFDKDLLLEAGLLVEIGNRLVDRFRGRVMIPIADAQGHIVAFGGRAIIPAASAKYLNSPETPFFTKGKILFHLHQAKKEMRKTQTAILFEGYMDVLSAWQAGIHNGVGSMGTALTPYQAKLLRRYVDRVIVAYDGDNAGINATKKALRTLSEAGISVRTMTFDDGLDPDDFIKRYGDEAFRRHFTTHVLSEVQFLLKELRAHADLQSAPGRNDFIRKALQIIGERATPVEEETEMKALANDFGISMETLKEEMALVAKKDVRKKSAFNRQISSDGTPPLGKRKGHEVAADKILTAMMNDRSVSKFLMERCVDELILPEQTALLALLYHYYEEHADGSAAAFIDDLEDQRLRGLATKLWMEEPPECTPSVLEDYLRTIAKFQLENQLRGTLAQLVEAQQLGDDSKVAFYREQMEHLQDQITQLRDAHSPGNSNSGAKEAGNQ